MTYIYESWLTLQQNRRRRLDGKQHWLNVVKSDAELIELSGSTLETIQHRAQNILSQLNAEHENQSTTEAINQNMTQQNTSSFKRSLMARLFEIYDATDDTLSRCAIAHLIKNGCRISETEENLEKFAHRIHRKQKEIEQLQAQLQARLPKGRDLTGEEFLKILTLATQKMPESIVQMQEWQAKLLARPASLPYPIIYGSVTNVHWSKTPKGRITVSFNGMDKYLKNADPKIREWFKTHKEHPFKLCCDQRQLPFFERFVEDWQVKDTYPPGLLTLSLATLAWREGEGKGEPWNRNHLVLCCSFDTRLVTAEGTLEVQQEKLNKVLKKLTRANPDPRNHSILNRLRSLPQRPSQKPYQGNPEILVGLSIEPI